MTPQKVKRAIALAAGLSFVFAVGWILNHNLRIEKREREAHFVTLHFLAMEASRETAVMFQSPPANLDELLKNYTGGSGNSDLLKPFPDGLIYYTKGASFTLEEPKSRRVALFRSDRLIASESQWPRWESSNEYASKFDGQVVPPAGYPEQ